MVCRCETFFINKITNIYKLLARPSIICGGSTSDLLVEQGIERHGLAYSAAGGDQVSEAYKGERGE